MDYGLASRGKPQHPASLPDYCLSNTKRFLTAWPFEFVPVWVTVRVLPFADTTTFALMVTFPPIFQVLM